MKKIIIILFSFALINAQMLRGIKNKLNEESENQEQKLNSTSLKEEYNQEKQYTALESADTQTPVFVAQGGLSVVTDTRISIEADEHIERKEVYNPSQKRDFSGIKYAPVTQTKESSQLLGFSDQDIKMPKWLDISNESNENGNEFLQYISVNENLNVEYY